MLVKEPMYNVLKNREYNTFYSSHIPNNITAGYHYRKCSLSHATTAVA